MTLTLEDIPVTPADESPSLSGEPEFACEKCGVELHYSGRGRKPKYCDDHKRRNNSGRSAIPTGANDKLAGMALDILCQGNAAFAVGFMFMRLNRSASALADRDEAFRAQAYEALKLDPALCRLILKGGASSGKVALGLAYLGLGISIAPVIVSELKERREEKNAETEVYE